MRPVLGALLSAGVLLCCAGVPVLAGEPGDPELAIYLDFEGDPSEVALDSMKKEVAAIMEPVGLNLQWRALADGGCSESFRELAVMRFTGRCRMDAPPDFEPQAAALGMAKMSDGEILPFGEVACNRVRGVISTQMGSGDGRKRDSLMGRALGRVVAHELYHILTRTRKHAAEGVAKPYYTARDMLGNTLVFQPKQVNLLKKNRPSLLPASERPAAVRLID
ncbi:MAG: hypothetical protein IT158_11405 [Bryobacterales bacterium]|nr:hypothetical protein [Bryobacterales bacterium]